MPDLFGYAPDGISAVTGNPITVPPRREGVSEKDAAKTRKRSSDVSAHKANNRRVRATIGDHLLAITEARSFGTGWTPWLSVREWADGVTERKGSRCPEDSARRILGNLRDEALIALENEPGTGAYRAMLTEAGRAALEAGQ